MTKEEKLKLVGESLKKINKNFGDNAILTLDKKPLTKENVISTGSIGLDIALGVGGFPKGRIIEIYAPESVGKTTLAIHTIANSQKEDGICAFIDAEHAFDKAYAEKLGVNINELLLSQPSCAEEALQIADDLASGGGVDVIVIDSVAALIPMKELEGDIGSNNLGLTARLMGQALRKLIGSAAKNNVLIIFLNQIREKIGVMFGSPETTSGGNALKFFASIRLDMRRSTSGDNLVKGKDGESLGNLVKVKVIKNKVAPPFMNCEFDILYGVGIDKVGELIQLGKDKDILKLRAGVITYNDEKYNYDDFRLMIEDNPEFLNEIRNKILN
mgnify:CR=1 FL=1